MSRCIFIGEEAVLSSTLLQVLMAGEMLHMLTLRKDPREVKVCGGKSTKLMLVLNLETKRTKKEPGGNVIENIHQDPESHNKETISIIC